MFMLQGSLFIGLCSAALVTGGCASSSKTSEPRTVVSDQSAPEPSEPGLQAGHELDVGVEFEGGDDEEASRRGDRAPPPTQAYSPAHQLEDDEKTTGP